MAKVTTWLPYCWIQKTPLCSHLLGLVTALNHPLLKFALNSPKPPYSSDFPPTLTILSLTLSLAPPMSPGHYHWPAKKSPLIFQDLAPSSVSLWCLYSLSHVIYLPPSQVDFPGGSDGKASACNAGDLGSIPRSGRSPGEGNDNPLQHSCLENPMDRGAW